MDLGDLIEECRFLSDLLRIEVSLVLQLPFFDHSNLTRPSVLLFVRSSSSRPIPSKSTFEERWLSSKYVSFTHIFFVSSRKLTLDFPSSSFPGRRRDLGRRSLQHRRTLFSRDGERSRAIRFLVSSFLVPHSRLLPSRREAATNLTRLFSFLPSPSLFLLWPFIESYWLASVALFGLFSSEQREESDGNVRWVSQAEFLKASQAMGKTLFWQVCLVSLVFDPLFQSFLF